MKSKAASQQRRQARAVKYQARDWAQYVAPQAAPTTPARPPVPQFKRSY